MFIYRLSYSSLFTSKVSEFSPPPPLLWEVKGRSKGQLARVCPSPPSPPNLYDHQTVGYKGQVNSKFEHSRVILRGGAITLHLFLPCPLVRPLLYRYALLFYCWHFMQCNWAATHPYGSKRFARLSHQMYLWLSGTWETASLSKTLVNSLIFSVMLENSSDLSSLFVLLFFISLYWYLSNPV